MNVGNHDRPRLTARRWPGLALVTLCEQSLVSASTFVLNVALARETEPGTYGTFAIAFAVLLFVAGAHNAVLIEPLGVVGPSEYRGRYGSYARTVLALNMPMTLGVAIAASLILEAFRPRFPLDGLTIGSLGLAAPFVLSFWLLRGCAYLFTQPGTALIGAVVYALALAGSLLVAIYVGGLSPSVALICLGLAGGSAAAVIFRRLGIDRAPKPLPVPADVLRAHWRYGRWIVGAAIAHGIGYGLCVPLLAAVGGPEQAGALRAMQNVLLPLERLTSGMSMLALPILTARAGQFGTPWLRRTGTALTAALAGVAVVYALIVSQLAGPLLGLLYRDSFYSSQTTLLALVSVAAVVAATAQFLAVVARAGNMPRVVFWSKLTAAGVLGLLGWPLVGRFGTAGAAGALSVAAMAELLVVASALLGTRHPRQAP